MRKASNTAAKEILNNDVDSPEKQLQFVLQTARAIAHNDAKMTQRIKKNPAQVGKFIEMNHLGNVIMRCPRLFHECASKIANGQIKNQIIDNDQCTSRPKGGRSAQLKRLLKLWSPFERKAINLAIIREDNTTTNSDEAAEALARGWSKVFDKKNSLTPSLPCSS